MTTHSISSLVEGTISRQRSKMRNARVGISGDASRRKGLGCYSLEKESSSLRWELQRKRQIAMRRVEGSI